MDDEHSRRVRDMFAGIASRYDFLNHLLSGNIDRRWRRIVARDIRALDRRDATILDLACGTGDLSIILAAQPDARVVGVDFCRPMLEIATRKAVALSNRISFVEGDALRIPFEAESFDIVTVAFGVRNLSDLERGLKELRRVLKPAGRVLILEFSKPVVPGFRLAFQFYFKHVLPRLGGLLSGSRGAYEYLPDSVNKFPDQQRLATLMRNAGFKNVSYRNLTGGIAALHTGTAGI